MILLASFILIGLTISFYYLSKAAYFYAKYKWFSVFDKDFKEYKRFLKELENDKIIVTRKSRKNKQNL